MNLSRMLSKRASLKDIIHNKKIIMICPLYHNLLCTAIFFKHGEKKPHLKLYSRPYRVSLSLNHDSTAISVN